MSWKAMVVGEATNMPTADDQRRQAGNAVHPPQGAGRNFRGILNDPLQRSPSHHNKP